MPAAITACVRDKHRCAHGQQGILKIIKGIGFGIWRGFGKTRFIGGQFAQIGVTHGYGCLAARGVGTQSRVGAHGIPFRLRPAHIANFVAARLVEQHRHITLADGGLGHFPRAKGDAHKSGRLIGLLGRRNKQFVFSCGLGVHIQILRVAPEVFQCPHPRGHVAVARGNNLAAACGQQGKTGDKQGKVKTRFHEGCSFLQIWAAASGNSIPSTLDAGTATADFTVLNMNCLTNKA
ncbi:hypothetical protein DSECCO2_251930 [anaerobic digester metagenome]